MCHLGAKVKMGERHLRPVLSPLRDPVFGVIQTPFEV